MINLNLKAPSMLILIILTVGSNATVREVKELRLEVQRQKAALEEQRKALEDQTRRLDELMSRPSALEAAQNGKAAPPVLQGDHPTPINRPGPSDEMRFSAGIFCIPFDRF